MTLNASEAEGIHFPSSNPSEIHHITEAKDSLYYDFAVIPFKFQVILRLANMAIKSRLFFKSLVDNL